jgi:ERCC4-type nuclease
MKLVLDERETALYDKCTTMLTSKTSTILEKRVLLLGDVAIQTDDSQDVVLIERKSLQDLLASIKDGRYDEQSYRLHHSSGFHTHNIVYIIEGQFSTLRNPAMEKKIALSAMISLSLIKGFSVIRTNSLQETTEWICAAVDKLSRDFSKKKTLRFTNSSNLGNQRANYQDQGNQEEKDPIIVLEHEVTNEMIKNNDPANYCSVVKKSKKENITPQNIGEILLCQIPGISSVSAIAIMKEFDNSFPRFLENLKQHPHCIDEICCSTTKSDGSTKKRKLAKSLCDNIRAFLLDQDHAVMDTSSSEAPIEALPSPSQTLA